MKVKTQQITSVALPSQKNRDIGLMVGCVNCCTARVFKVNEVLKLLMNRKSAGHMIGTQCEKCGHLISVGVFWIDAQKPGYSHRKIEFSHEENVQIVSDESGLSQVVR